MIEKSDKLITLKKEHIEFYAKLKIIDIVNIPSEKIHSLVELAAKYSLQNQLERYSFNSRWSRAVQKAYSSASQNSINIGSFSFGSTCTRVSVENAAELLLFIMFVTDPTFMLIESSRNNSTIAEIKEFSEKYLGFWDLKLFMLERKYLQMIEEQKNEEIKEHLAKCTQGRKTF